MHNSTSAFYSLPVIYQLFPWCPLCHEYCPVAPIKNEDSGLIPFPQALWSPAPPVLCVKCRFLGPPMEFWFRKPGLRLRICILNSQVTYMTVQVWETLFFYLPHQINPFQSHPHSDLWTFWNLFTFLSYETEMRPWCLFCHHPARLTHVSCSLPCPSHPPPPSSHRSPPAASFTVLCWLRNGPEKPILPSGFWSKCLRSIH